MTSEPEEETVAEFEALIRRFDRESVHLEMRDAYGTEVELPHMAAWAAGEPDDDFFMLDRRLVIFLHAGSGLNTDVVTSTNPHDIELCSNAFDAVWRIGVPHRQYVPS